MPFAGLLECRPAGKALQRRLLLELDRSHATTPKVVEYAPDYGLANNVSWAAQWANEYGVTNYENLAVSGSEPAELGARRQLYTKRPQQIEAEDPDYVLMTIGANPLLSEMLFGRRQHGLRDLRPTSSATTANASKKRSPRVAPARQPEAASTPTWSSNTSATIYLMQYHLSIPSAALAYSADPDRRDGRTAERRNRRGRRRSQPERGCGSVDPAPLQRRHRHLARSTPRTTPARASASRSTGPSVQSEPTQDELELDHPLSFCAGPGRTARPG